MQVRVLGCGTIAGRTGKNCSGYLIDEQILLDCGPGIWSALYSAEQPLKQINHILLSHFHVDHISDLIPFLWGRWVLEEERGSLLSIYGPVGLNGWFKKMTIPHTDWIKDLAISLHELGNKKTEAGLYTVETRSTGHTANSICLKLSDPRGKSVFYSGDSGWNENLIELAARCDLAIIDSANSSENKTEDHLTPELAARVASSSGAKRLMLTHLYPEVWDTDPAEEAGRHFNGEILLARDRLVVFF